VPLEPPLPRGWESKRTPLEPFGVVVFMSMALFWFYHGVRAVIDLDPWRVSFYSTAATISAVLFAATIVEIRSRVTPTRTIRFRQAKGSTTILLSRYHDANMLILHILLAVCTTVFVSGVVTNRLDIPLTSDQRVSFPIMLAVCAVGCVYMLAVRLPNCRYGALHLTPSTVTYTMGTHRVMFDWNDIASLTAQAPAFKNKWIQLVVVTFNNGRAPARLDPRRFSIGDDATFWILHHYAAHPESRDELADERATRRVADGRLFPWPESRTGGRS
jgi:hypothetical protein